jgi:hypothetical protein
MDSTLCLLPTRNVTVVTLAFASALEISDRTLTATQAIALPV